MWPAGLRFRWPVFNSPVRKQKTNENAKLKYGIVGHQCHNLGMEVKNLRATIYQL